MRNYLFLLLFINLQYLHAQSVTIEPGKQGFSNTNTPNGTLEMNGNGMLLQQKVKLTEVNPQSNIISLVCGSTQVITSHAGIIMDPNGENPYLPGIDFQCNFYFNITDPDVIGIKFTVLESDFGIGDRLYNNHNFIPFLNQTNPHVGESFIAKNETIFFYFNTNNDQSIGQGFKLQWQTVYADGLDNPFKNIGQMPKFAVDYNKHIFRFGNPNSNESFEPNSVAIGNNTFAPENSVVIGNNAQAFSGGIVIGHNSKSEIFEGIVIGNNSGSRFGGIALGDYAQAESGIAIGENNDIQYGVGLGFGNNLFRGYALGSDLSHNGSYNHNTLLGKFNGNSRTAPSTSTNRIFELANGSSNTDRHNAITVLDNGNTGLGIYQPTENLDVEKNARIRGNLIVNGNQTHGGDFTLASDKKITVQDIRGIGTEGLFLGNPTARIMQILGNGKVAFGTNSLLTPPTRDFEVTGSAQFKSSVEVINDLTVSDLTKSNQMLVGDGLANFNATTKFHLRNGTSGSTTASSVHLARIENDDHAFLTFAVPSDKMAGIQFLKPGTTAFPDQFIGSIRLTESNNFDFRLGENSTRMRLNPQGDLQIGMGITANGCLKDGNGTILAGTCASDSRYKKNVKSFKPLLSEFVKLNPVHFDWKVDEFPDQGFGNEQSYGFIAQEIEKVFPDLVITDKNGFKAVNYTKLNIMTIQAVKELKAENDQLKVVIASILKDIEILKLSSNSAESK